MDYLRSLFTLPSSPSSTQRRSTSPKQPTQPKHTLWLENSSSKKLPPLNAEYLMQMESFLQKYLVNQTLAIKSLTFILLRYHSKLYAPIQRPIVPISQQTNQPSPPPTNPLFLTFIGSSGLGKIYASKLVAHYCHRQFIYIDLALLENQVYLLDQKLFEVLQWYALEVAPLATSNGLVICLNHLESINEEMMEYLLDVLHNKTWKCTRVVPPPQQRKKEDTSSQPMEEEMVLHCKQVIFVGVVEMKDQMVMDLLQETMCFKSTPTLQMNPTSARVPPQIATMTKKPPQQQNVQQQQPIIEQKEEHSLNFSTERISSPPISQQKPLQQEPTLPQPSNLDILDCITEFREKMTPKLLQEHSLSIPFLLRINQMIPFFPFTNQTLLHEIVTTMNHLLQQYYQSTQIQIKYGEEVVIWAMKRWKPSMNISNLIENHIVTNLASIESELKPQDSVYLTIEPQTNKLVMRIHSIHPNKHYSIVSKL